MEDQDSNYTLFVKALLKKDLEKLDISPFSDEQKKEIEKVGNIFLDRNMILESIQTFYLLRNFARLNQIGEILLKNKQNEFAFEAYRYAKNQDGLNQVGEAFISNAEIEKAYRTFKLADNKQMIEFIEQNFEVKFK